ncbi:Hypothetical_protein [Hexamita inflata]|uniref:Hypothetical_protein n=1 Tax=Hexamita inflata TaxID=28002 RepID=A0AA86U559_9EUKA|nr:Hypothetical protein HINF_LOCUS28949 [Hexamita inflata]
MLLGQKKKQDDEKEQQHKLEIQQLQEQVKKRQDDDCYQTYSILGTGVKPQQLPIYQKIQVGLLLPEQKLVQRYNQKSQKEAILRYIRLGCQKYEQERQMQGKHGVILPGLSTVQNYYRKLLTSLDYYDANIGETFDPTKHMRNIPIWKQKNNLDPNRMYKGCLQMDAVNINKQVTQNVKDKNLNKSVIFGVQLLVEYKKNGVQLARIKLNLEYTICLIIIVQNKAEWIKICNKHIHIALLIIKLNQSRYHMQRKKLNAQNKLSSSKLLIERTMSKSQNVVENERIFNKF